MSDPVEPFVTNGRPRTGTAVPDSPPGSAAHASENDAFPNPEQGFVMAWHLRARETEPPPAAKDCAFLMEWSI